MATLPTKETHQCQAVYNSNPVLGQQCSWLASWKVSFANDVVTWLCHQHFTKYQAVSSSVFHSIGPAVQCQFIDKEKI